MRTKIENQYLEVWNFKADGYISDEHDLFGIATIEWLTNVYHGKSKVEFTIYIQNVDLCIIYQTDGEEKEMNIDIDCPTTEWDIIKTFDSEIMGRDIAPDTIEVDFETKKIEITF